MKIYHFTKLKNAINILKYGKLNFGNLDYSNDPSEGLYPTKVIENSILNIYGRGNTSRNMIALFRINTTLNDDLHIYSISFTSKLDEIHNWMEYGNYGKGVAFEFDFLKLAILLEKEDKNNSLAIKPVIYSEKKIYNRIKEICVNSKNDSNNGEPNVLPTYDVIDLYPIIKNKAYKSEKELRISFVEGPPSGTIDNKNKLFLFDSESEQYYLNVNLLINEKVLVGIHLGSNVTIYEKKNLKDFIRKNKIDIKIHENYIPIKPKGKKI